VLRGRVQDARRRLRVVRRIVELLLSAQAPPPKRGEIGAKPARSGWLEKKAGGGGTRPARRWLQSDVVFAGSCCSTNRSYSAVMKA
jgi:hypothetical protein